MEQKKEQLKPNSQSGQVVIILLLVMVVTLGIGLSVIGRSTTEISTSTKTEDSSRAFSAAEAGLERAFIQQTYPAGTPIPTIAVSGLSNQSSASVNTTRIPDPINNPGIALEYAREINRDSFAQFWFVDPRDVDTPYYNQGSFDIYFGDPSPQNDPQNQPAVKIHVIYWDGAKYADKSFVVDSYYSPSEGRYPTNNFLNCTGVGSDSNVCELKPPAITTDITGHTRSFYRRYRVNVLSTPLPANNFLVMARVRILYSDVVYPIAIQPLGSSLPPQTTLYNATGTSGNVQRKLQVSQPDMVLPELFDFALFSAGDLIKE